MRIIIIVACVSLLVTGCVFKKSGQTQNSNVPEVASENSQTQSEDSSANEYIEGEKYFITSININTVNGKTSFIIDAVEWLRWEDGTCHVRDEEGKETPECNPNGFLIQNSVEKLETYEVLPFARIRVTQWPSLKQVSLEEFIGSSAVDKYYFEFTPFIINIEDGVIAAIDQMYLP